ncbi:EamA family transporter [Cobetia marina]
MMEGWYPRSRGHGQPVWRRRHRADRRPWPQHLVTDPRLFATPGNAGVALYMALVPMFLGYLAFGYGLKTIAASKATLLTLFEPLVAALPAVTIVGEHSPRSAGSAWNRLPSAW